MTSTSKTFASEGFDLDAVADSSSEKDVVLEIGGGATTVTTATTATAAAESQEEASQNDNKDESNQPQTPIQVAEDWKQKGNVEFKQGNYLEAYDLYTEAMEACPCPIKGPEILQQREEFNAAEREKARQRMDEETRRGRKTNVEAKDEKSNSNSSENQEEPEKPEGPAVFVLPPQDYGDKLAVYYCNRAAASMQLERYQEAIDDCDVAVLLLPTYAKAFTRRSAAYEKTERTEEALRDAKRALELEPSNANIRKSVARLQKIEDERLEKLKVGLLIDDDLCITTAPCLSGSPSLPCY
jgi:tetratricopeptide (TPR) repeat protein